jgi:drug/metabolite transporter (DMT)-like permease
MSPQYHPVPTEQLKSRAGAATRAATAAIDNQAMRFFKTLTPRTVGISAAIVTIIIWTSFIIIARATSDPARGAILLPLDIVLSRIFGAALILLPWGWWLVRRDRAQAADQIALKPPILEAIIATMPVRQAQAAINSVAIDATKNAINAAAVGDMNSATNDPAKRESSLCGFSPLSLKITALTGLFGGVLYGVFAYSGFVFAPAAHASVLLPGSLPLWTSLLAVWVLHEKLTPARVTSLVLIVAGDLLVGGASLLRAFDGGVVWRGDVLFMVAALTWSTYTVLARKFALDAVRATIAITAFAAATFVPVYGLLIVLKAVPSHFMTAPVGDILFQMFFQGCGSVVILALPSPRWSSILARCAPPCSPPWCRVHRPWVRFIFWVNHSPGTCGRGWPW